MLDGVAVVAEAAGFSTLWGGEHVVRSIAAPSLSGPHAHRIRRHGPVRAHQQTDQHFHPSRVLTLDKVPQLLVRHARQVPALAVRAGAGAAAGPHL